MRPTANIIVLCTTVIAVTTIGVYGFLGVHNKDTQNLIQILGTIVTLLSLLWNNQMTKKTADKQDEISTQVDTIEKQTNGVLTKALNDLPAKITESVVPAIQDSATIVPIVGDKPNAN